MKYGKSCKKQGEAVGKCQGKAGVLTPRGQVFMEKEGLGNLKVWTSTMKRTIETASHISDTCEVCVSENA
jgi:hypothetical protein